MIGRIRRLVTMPRRAARRLATVEQKLAATEQEMSALQAQVRALAEVELHGLVVLAEHRILGVARWEIVASRRHTNEAVGAAQESAIRAARAHTEASVSASTKATLAAAQEHAQAASDASLVASREIAEALHRETIEILDRKVASVRRELKTLGRIRSIPSPTPEAPSAVPFQGVPTDPSFYVALEDRFRGDPATIADRQTIYLPLVEDLADTDHPLIDLGCGRGEWLKVLHDVGVPAVGVDSNPAFVAEAAEAGLAISNSDLVAYLHDLADGSAGAVSMFQVVEHLPFDVLIHVMAECLRVLRPGGVLIAETPNSLNLRVAASTFWLDPTHQRPLHPELLKFMAQQAGFSKVDGWFLNELREPNSRQPADPDVRQLFDLVDGAGDFTLLAWA